MDLEKRVIELVLPEVDICGLYFNEQKVRAVFKKQEDGWWQSEEILFMSARNDDGDNCRDVLTMYLNDRRLKKQLGDLFNVPSEAIIVALPKASRDAKKYHGVDCWYWLADPSPDSISEFCFCGYSGHFYNDDASAVGGCAPAFFIEKQ
jgi:hypothetical protein